MQTESQHEVQESVDLYQISIWLWAQKNILILFSTIAAIISIVIALSLPNYYISEATLMPKDTQLNVSLTGGGGMGGFDFGGLSSLVGLGGTTDNDPNVTLAKELLVSQKFLVDFVKKYDYTPELIQAVDWQNGEIQYSSDGYNKELDEMEWEPSDTDIYKAFLLSFTINHDRLTKYTKVGFEHFSPPLANELLNNLIREVNLHVRSREVSRAQKSIVFLDEQLKQTQMRDLNVLLSKLKENNLKTLMLAEIDEYFILDVVDPPSLPTEKSKPYRALIVVLGTFFGFLIAIFILGICRMLKIEVTLTFFPFRFKKTQIHT